MTGDLVTYKICDYIPLFAGDSFHDKNVRDTGKDSIKVNR